MTYPKVSVVTPIHNGIKETLRYLNSLFKITYPNYEVIIVDDGSTDRSAEIIRRKFPEVIILSGDGDLWWSGAINLGVRRALADGADYVLNMNNDVVVEKRFLAELVSCARKYPHSLIGSKILFLSNKKFVWYFGAKFDESTSDIALVQGRSTKFNKIQEAEFLTGMGTLIPAKAFKEVGYFDTKNFPQYFGDSDFSLRAKRRRYRLLVCPTSKIYNDTSSSWVARKMRDLSLSFGFTVLLAKNSPYNIFDRYKFYRLYWGRGYQGAFLRFYSKFIFKVIPRHYRSVLFSLARRFARSVFYLIFGGRARRYSRFLKQHLKRFKRKWK